MKRLIEFELEEGDAVLIEVDEPEAGSGIERVSRRGGEPERAVITFDQALTKVRPALKSIVSKVRALGEGVSEIGIEFGLKFEGKLGGVIASAGAEANFKITLTWKRQEDKKA